MSQKVTGNIRGLAPAQLKRVEKLYRRSLDSEELVSLDLARELHQTAHELRRRIGILVSREGGIEEVFLGTKDLLYLPDLGRYRLASGRLRRLRFIFSDLSKAPEPTIPQDVYADLEKLRLDAVVALKPGAKEMAISFAHLVPLHVSEDASSAASADFNAASKTTTVKNLADFELDFADFIDDLEIQLESARSNSRSLQGQTRAVLVGVFPKGYRLVDPSMAELKELARTAGVTICDTIVQRRDLDPKTLIGKGKLEELVLRCLRLDAETLIFDGELKPAQWRSIVNSTELKVLDRSMLILDIFARRAQSSAGRLQVELAQLSYNLPRLAEQDSGLSRLSGGIGGTGPGETKLEISRRRVRDRITMLERQISQLQDQRVLQRSRRKEEGVPVVAILGYTNVGKSTLFNAMTKEGVLAENKLFATLDTTHRRIHLPDFSKTDGTETARTVPIILSDTVGFIRDLPKELRAAFKATLDELHEASVLLHVVDGSDAEIDLRLEAVRGVLEELQITDLPQVIAINKADLMTPEALEALQQKLDGIPISALKRRGFDKLLEILYLKLTTI